MQWMNCGWMNCKMDELAQTLYFVLLLTVLNALCIGRSQAHTKYKLSGVLVHFFSETKIMEFLQKGYIAERWQLVISTSQRRRLLAVWA